MYVYIKIHVYIKIYVYEYIFMYIYIYMYMPTFICIYIYIYLFFATYIDLTSPDKASLSPPRDLLVQHWQAMKTSWADEPLAGFLQLLQVFGHGSCPATHGNMD